MQYYRRLSFLHGNDIEVKFLVFQIADLHFENYRFRVYFTNYRFQFRFVWQTTVSHRYQQYIKQWLNDDIKTTETRLCACRRTPNEGSEMLEKW